MRHEFQGKHAGSISNKIKFFIGDVRDLGICKECDAWGRLYFSMQQL